MKGAALDETAGKLLALGLGVLLLLVGAVGSLWPSPADMPRAGSGGERQPDRSKPDESTSGADGAPSRAAEAPPLAPRDDRLATVRTYLERVAAGRYRAAYEMLATSMTYDAFVAGVEASNKAFAESLGREDAELISKKIEKVEPITVEADYVIVTVTTRVSARRSGELYVQDMSAQVYCRFDARGRIALLYDVGA